MTELTNDFLILEHPNRIGGVQRIYRFPSGFGLSAINSPMAHSYPFAWEIAVLKGVTEDGHHGGLAYDTGLTEDTETFSTVEEANEFIRRAANVLRHPQ